jgi:class 3 adenylate cyclase
MQVLALPGAGEVITYEHGCSTLQFRGPRVRVGLYRGVPTRVVPHTTTGRADYFGCSVNRAARYCHTAAHGGQVVAPRELIEELVSFALTILGSFPQLHSQQCEDVRATSTMP